MAKRSVAMGEVCIYGKTSVPMHFAFSVLLVFCFYCDVLPEAFLFNLKCSLCRSDLNNVLLVPHV